MSKLTAAGATALVGAPAIALVGITVTPTMSDDAADQVTALTAHHSAMIAGLTLQTVAVGVFIAGIAWLALAVRQPAPRAALAGGVVGIGGFLIVLFESGVAAAAPGIAAAVDQGTATSVIASIHSGALAGLEPLSLLGDAGLAILGIAATKAGAARWTAAAIAVGGFGEGAGFATGTKWLLIVMFTVLLVGLAGACASLVAGRAALERTDALGVGTAAVRV